MNAEADDEIAYARLGRCKLQTPSRLFLPKMLARKAETALSELRHLKFAKGP
jgi:hypothetical protein